MKNQILLFYFLFTLLVCYGQNSTGLKIGLDARVYPEQYPDQYFSSDFLNEHSYHYDYLARISHSINDLSSVGIYTGFGYGNATSHNSSWYDKKKFHCESFEAAIFFRYYLYINSNWNFSLFSEGAIRYKLRANNINLYSPANELYSAWLDHSWEANIKAGVEKKLYKNLDIHLFISNDILSYYICKPAVSTMYPTYDLDFLRNYVYLGTGLSYGFN